MNNKFLCRGKRKDTGKWVEGYYVEMPVGEKEPLYLIIGLDGQYNRVIPDTVGRCTAMNDCNGKKIFEGDILRYGNYALYTVFWDEKTARFSLSPINALIWYEFDTIDSTSYEIIGNIHDNPELIGGNDND